MKKRTIKKMKGAVTIFLVIVLFTTTLLGGVFIDATRILLAKRTLRNSINSAARSALSYYDVDISTVYGLFGVTEKEATEAFEKYLDTNLRLSKNDGFNIMEITPIDDGIHITLTGALSENDAMQSGIDEYSKYRAFVDTAEWVAEKLKPMFGGESGIVNVQKAAKRGQNAVESLKDEVKGFSQKARDLISTALRSQADRCKNYVEILAMNPDKPVDDDSLGFTEMDKSFDAAEAENNKIDDSIEKYEKENREASNDLSSVKQGTVSYYDEESNSWKTDSGSDVGADEELAARATEQADSLKTSAESEKDTVKNKIDSTKANYQENKQKITQKTKEAQDLTREINRLKIEQTAAQALADEAKDNLDQINKEKRADRFAFIWGDDPDLKLQGMKKELDMENSQLNLMKVQGASEDEIKEQQQKIKKLEKQMDDYIEDMEIPPKTAYDDKIDKAKALKEVADESLEAVKANIKKCEKERKKLLEEIKKLYEEIPAESSSAGNVSMADKLDEQTQNATKASIVDLFLKVKNFFQDTVEEVKKTDLDNPTPSGSGVSKASGKIDEIDSEINTNKSIWDLMDEMTDFLDGIKKVFSKEGGGEAYLATNYAFSKFSFLTSQTGWSNHYFQLGEIEYMLGDKSAQIDNIIDSLKNIFWVRFFINLINYFIVSNGTPGFVARFIYSAARALLQSVRDMFDMIFTADSEKSATCQFSPSFPKVRVRYSDHLIIRFMLGYVSDKGQAKIMGRMRTMMTLSSQVQGWTEVSELYTRIQGTAEVKVNLIMLTLPMFEAVLPKDNKIIQDGHFILRETVELGY